MIDNLDEIDPNSVGAILYSPRDDVDRLLADFVQDIAQQGVRIGGIVQRHSRRTTNGTHVMLAIDVATGQEILISQPLGSGAMFCNLDTNGLAEAAAVVSQALRIAHASKIPRLSHGVVSGVHQDRSPRDKQIRQTRSSWPGPARRIR
ncbi:DUF2478 domain-containing protein [Bradyrhizobium sp. CCBAU 53415]|uniref:DUF2478 domain-containing protein n=1 Tax=Bradyrhizobium sp. CCBAU 53415 TaxID=1325119 RepID=UPI002FE3F271